MQVAVVEAGEHRVVGGVDDLGPGGARIGVDLLDRADRDDLSPSTSTEPGSNATAPPVMGRTMPLRMSVGIGPPWSVFNKLSNAIRGVFTGVTRNRRSAAR